MLPFIPVLTAAVVSWFACATVAAAHPTHPSPTWERKQPPSHAEPLLFDLVRRLNVEQGEREWGTLFRVEGDKLEYATEFEWASEEGRALEIEVGNVHSPERFIKGAVQNQLGTAWDERLLHGIHLSGGLELEEGRGNWGLAHITSYRINPTWSAMLIAGGRGAREKEQTSWSAQLDSSLFADITEEFILGGETNIRVAVNGETQFTLMPQLRWDQAEGFHVQFGLGGVWESARISPITALRVNHAF
jgi:hypothetical protein